LVGPFDCNNRCPDSSIDTLVRKDLITKKMATSLMHDSVAVKHIVHGLITVTELLYIQIDRLLDEKVLDITSINSNEGILTYNDE